MGPRKQWDDLHKAKEKAKTLRGTTVKQDTTNDYYDIQEQQDLYWKALEEWERKLDDALKALELELDGEGLDASGKSQVLRDRAEVWHWMGEYHVLTGSKGGQVVQVPDYERAYSCYDRCLIELERARGDQDEQNRIKTAKLKYLLEYAQVLHNHSEVRRSARDFRVCMCYLGVFAGRAGFCVVSRDIFLCDVQYDEKKLREARLRLAVQK